MKIYKNTRGEAAALLIIALAAGAAALLVVKPSGSPGKDHWWQFWRKDPVAQVQRTQKELDDERAKQDAAIAKAKADADTALKAQADAIKGETAKQLGTAHEAVVATGLAIQAAQTTAAAGALPKRELSTAATLNATAQAGLDQALGPVIPQRIRELEQMVRDLGADNAAGRGALQAMQGALDASVRREADLRTEQTRMEEQARAAISAAEKTRDAALKDKDSALRDAMAKEQSWALERDALARRWESAMFWGKCLGGLLIAACVVVLVLLLKTKTLTTFGGDMVGLVQMLRGKIKEKATSDEYAALNQQISKDWSTVEDGTAALVEKFKNTLRL